ncbi:DUF3370 domain-containing protein [Acaryochloris sp. IP29b_bin.148]|uniref:DUF3370 domain-containing protein n=1 Tax=Acaryochloris sp. IP29b_bin.148 TaxID=2969218 RepID=UPI002617F811|nr:DUF3370 domain-containing protein [Acaryochloris sp. IP29b_bin.148]
MSIFLSSLLLAQASPVAAASEVVIPQEVRALPGKLDQFPVFNSNSPEVVKSEGILLSTFPGTGKQHPQAHLNYALSGRFDVFAHHVTRVDSKQGKRPLYLGVLLHNPTSKPVKVLVLQANSYLSQSQAPFVDLPDHAADPGGKFFSGPGSRTAGDVLRRQRQAGWETNLVIPPGQSKMLVNLQLPPSNSRTTWLRLWTNGKLYAASMTRYARSPSKWKFQAPLLEDWKQILTQSNLVSPRDKPPTPPDSKAETFLYGRVAGVSQGSEWKAKVTNKPGDDQLDIPKPGEAISYVINSLDRGTLGTGQIQSAPMLVRYDDTAYKSHGNYGLRYKLDLPLKNATNDPQKITLSLQTPIKEDELTQKGLRFLKQPTGSAFFRGTVKLSYTDTFGKAQKRFFHLVQRRGQRGKALITLPIDPKQQTLVNVEFLYPPDSTPPQVLTIKTISPK